MARNKCDGLTDWYSAAPDGQSFPERALGPAAAVAGGTLRVNGDFVTERNGRRHVLQKLLLMPDAHVIQRAAYALPITDNCKIRPFPCAEHATSGTCLLLKTLLSWFCVNSWSC